MLRTHLILLLFIVIAQCATPRRSFGVIGYAGEAESAMTTAEAKITVEQCLDWKSAYRYGPPSISSLIQKLAPSEEAAFNVKIYASYQCLRLESSR